MWPTLASFALLVTLMSVAAADEISPEFITEFYARKNIRQIVTFACWNEPDVVRFYRHVAKADVKISYVEIQEGLDMPSVLKVNYYKLGVVLDMDCPNSQSIFDQLRAAKLPFNDSYAWLSVTSASEVPITTLNELPLTVESEFTLALVQKTGGLALYDAYNHGYRHGGKLNVTSMGRWDERAGLINHLTQYKYKRRQDFHGLTLNFSIALTTTPTPDLETYLTQPINPHLDTMNRFHYNVILQLRDFYNFKISLTRTNSWGYMVNGSWNGILGGMVKGIVDISASPLYYIKDRLAVCDYTVETYVVRTYFIFRHPKKNSLRNPFLKPFAQNVWLLSLQVGITCWLLLLIIVKIENRYNINNDQLCENPSSETAIIAIAAVSQQGTSDGPHLYSGRLVFITLFLWALMMYQFYSADIVGSLIAAPPRFINTIKDLIDSDLHMAHEDVPYAHDYFRTTKDPDSLYLKEKKYKQAKKKKHYNNAYDGLSEVSKGGYAFLLDTATAYKIIEDTFTQEQICDLTEIPLVAPKYVTLVTSKHSPFKKMVMYGLRKIVEHGLVNRMTRVWKTRRPNCPESFRSQPQPVEMKEASPAMLLVVGGLILATLVMAAEQLTARHRFSAEPGWPSALERGQVMPEEPPRTPDAPAF